MLNPERRKTIIATLNEKQAAGMTLSEAVHALHVQDKVPFDDIWPALMRLQQVSEKEAMRFTKACCLKAGSCHQ